MKLELANLKFFAGAVLAIVINPGCGGITAIGDNSGVTGGNLNAETGGLSYGGPVNTGGIPAAGGAAATSGQVGVGGATGCVQGAVCTTGVGQCKSFLGQECLCNSGLYMCDSSDFGGASSTGGQAGVGGATSCTQGAVCTGLSQCGTSGETCKCNGGQYYCSGSLASGGAAATGGTAGALSCAGVNCPAIPDSCTDIVQDPNACCPTCTDTGCDPCADITCASGTHLDTPAGACCPQCVVDPVDPCTQGQQNYAAMRATLLDKYGSLGCNNSSDCVIVLEDNLCVANCGDPLPSSMAASFEANLTAEANNDCATCSTPVPPNCVSVVPACVNGKCVTANPS